MNNVRMIKFQKKDLEKFSFMMNFYCCWKLRTGVCSLDKEPKVKLSRVQMWNYSEIRGCVEVESTLTEEGYNESFEMTEHSCGHISMPDGQHRTCVGIRLGLEIPVSEYNKVTYKCTKCLWKEQEEENERKKTIFTKIYEKIIIKFKKDNNGFHR